MNINNQKYLKYKEKYIRQKNLLFGGSIAANTETHLNNFMDLFDIKYFKYTPEDSFECSESNGYYNVEWILKEPIIYSEFIKPDHKIYSEINTLANFSYSCNFLNRENNNVFVKGPQQIHLHFSLEHNFPNEDYQAFFFRLMNKIWVERGQHLFIYKYNNLFNSWESEFEGACGKRNKYDPYARDNPIKSWDGPGFSILKSILDDGSSHYPPIWGDDEDSLYDDNRYVVLNYFPSHKSENKDGYLPIHLEYRAFAQFFSDHKINEWIITNFGSIYGYLQSFIRDIAAFMEYCVSQYNRYLENKDFIVWSHQNLKFGLEIETCFDLNKFLVYQERARWGLQANGPIINGNLGSYNISKTIDPNIFNKI